MAREDSRSDHDRLVAAVARHLKKRFYRDIRARTPGFPAPAGIASGAGEFVPDVTVVARGTQFHLLEVETPASLEERRTPDKWSVFARHVAEENAHFTVVVPKEALEQAQDKLRDLGVEAKVWGL